MEYSEQNKLTKWSQSHGYREQTDSCQRGGVGGWMRRVKGLSKEKKSLIDRVRYGDCQREGGGEV